ncbi:CDP-glucose 4,6-dehydratase [Limnothrix sp. FACHB-1083]|uniref:CDP-glucose 4,6-dehydratase n=1 Tax=unclassified Limnothrix TaxID=2632864 RepID=UPI00168171ED|nr:MULTISPECIES: CDP-glucose 4,6-dehydratase [unclassified Limnothrix]MBD2160575.1 CDP-glucose 4,6-dehydratase [Limnothrix sp. FACHB-1083]MBD2191277.1 CDP-glucose 4,6-dehydratase [Limnothrix sp. FACHB-1088]
MVINSSPWQGRRVLVTGHTGFKGSWLCLWLHSLGGDVYGLALDPPTQPNLYKTLLLHGLLVADARIDIRNFEAVKRVIIQAEPEIIFHLAAQSLVQTSYASPIETYATNVMGTAHVLEAARLVDSVRAIIVVTTDKCYENQEWVYPYRENDRLGGFDPYSNSKACAELVVSAYRSSFLGPQGIAVATARAGNVIGGGDWATGRLIPDCVRAFQADEPLKLRYPQAVRPWQHVLEPLSGYLRLAEALLGDRALEFCEAWNFGPDAVDTVTVGEVAKLAAEVWGGTVEIAKINPDYHEAGLLQLDSSKARSRLQWKPRWSLNQAVESTVSWYRAYYDGQEMQQVTQEQILEFVGVTHRQT